jgi:hypothetical protein
VARAVRDVTPAMNATMQVAFQTVLADTAGAVLDPWATVPTGDDVVTSMWGQMVECEDPMVTDRCFVKYSSSGLERYIVYDQYNSCAQSWILLPGFNLLEQKLLIGACPNAIPDASLILQQSTLGRGCRGVWGGSVSERRRCDAWTQ